MSSVRLLLRVRAWTGLPHLVLGWPPIGALPSPPPCGWSRRDALALARATRDAATDGTPSWTDMAAIGWLGLHLPEAHGGSGFGLAELAVVLEATGAALLPGPLLPSVLASYVIDRAGDEAYAPRCCPASPTGRGSAASAAPSATAAATRSGPVPRCRCSARRTPTRCCSATHMTCSSSTRRARGHDHRARQPRPHPSQRTGHPRRRRVRRRDPTRGRVRSAVVRRHRPRRGRGGGRRACVRRSGDRLRDATRAVRARDRLVPSGQAPAGRRARLRRAGHRGRVGRARALDAADDARVDEQTPYACAVAGAVAFEAYEHCAKTNIQVHGGIGCTYEHDAHLWFRRATALTAAVRTDRRAPRSTWPSSPRAAWCAAPKSISVPTPTPSVHRCRRSWPATPRSTRPIDPTRWPTAATCSPTGPSRGAVARGRSSSSWSNKSCGARCVSPTWVSQSWNLPTIIAFGTPEQQEKWVGGTLRGEFVWCQLFSEPDAGSDLASLSHARPEGRRRLAAQRAEGVDLDRTPRRTWACAWPAPTRTRPSTRASAASSSTCSPPASTCGRSKSSPGTPRSTRCSSTTCSCPTTRSSARSTTVGRRTHHAGQRARVAVGRR